MEKSKGEKKIKKKVGILNCSAFGLPALGIASLGVPLRLIVSWLTDRARIFENPENPEVF